MKAFRAVAVIIAGTVTLTTACSPDAGPQPSATSSAASSAASSGPQASSAPSPSPTGAGSTGPTGSPSAAVSSISEPTTTNTLPPPPEPSKPAPSTAGRLNATSLPVPQGWRTVARQGGAEEGFEGNGTWVHARDPRYAATDTVSIGCAAVTRDDFTDPVAALEGNYTNRAGDPGVGLALQFRSVADAAAYYALYTRQVRACTDPSGLVVITTVPSGAGLIDRRTYPDDGQWTEVVKLAGARVTLVVLTDPGHRISTARSEALLAAIPG